MDTTVDEDDHHLLLVPLGREPSVLERAAGCMLAPFVWCIRYSFQSSTEGSLTSVNKKQLSVLKDLIFTFKQKRDLVVHACSALERDQARLQLDMKQDYRQLLEDCDARDQHQIALLDAELIYAKLRAHARSMVISAKTQEWTTQSLLDVTRCWDMLQSLENKIIYQGIVLEQEHCIELENSLNKLELDYQCRAFTCQVSKALFDLQLVLKLHNSHLLKDCADLPMEYEPSELEIRSTITDFKLRAF